MARSRSSMRCDDAVDAFNDAMRELSVASGNRARVPKPDNVEDRIVTRCQACRGKKSRSCTGWSVNLRAGPLISFDAPVGNRSVNVHVEGSQEWTFNAHSHAGTMVPTSGSFSITIFSESGEMITRQHSDIANLAQPGSVGHLQFGGLPSSGVRPRFEWLDQPRWPMMPFDPLLLTEFLIYSFFPDHWRKVARRGSWREAVHRSEDQMYGPWIARMNAYQDQRTSRTSWLHEQCNESSTWIRI